MTAFTGVDSQNLPDVMVSVQFILAIGAFLFFTDLLIFPKEKAVSILNDHSRQLQIAENSPLSATS
ncbi:hypothetical protein LDL72_02735 [Lactobacillus delbrueckii subsp. lactis DSM 20072]|uniref:hypothetical protein n=1 Tax=Lactobacillus delbrueckii TaxID=1584 RepID=UPI0009D5938E|nr:hypothetical protein [Lactobacillus delbrueckii]ASW11370.1 hypothetical protein LDL72_02735 [Lactobacillus delbrueckii subsp. lactis DSM 20072]OOV10310.1 hypothetical protein LL072_07695 [Lactobacillus delbrueckii subsp. lactis DSM 20072]